MDPRRFARVREVFLTARSLPAESRAEYLRRECGDDAALLHEVESLFDQSTQTHEIMKPGGPVGVIGRRLLCEIPPAQPIPERIGPYQILGILGAGGMGIVYRALQTTPIRREVALKLIRGDLISRGAAARFESERQTLAQMEHPNIARVLEAGEDEAGRSYVVMELVQGMAITEFCAAEQLPLRERLELFRQVCLAVQHAHQKGVIHRDLKPSNVLVTIQDGRAHPKLIDFGIAKALGDSGTESARLTREGQLVGTLEYMSPEQVTGGLAQVDVRSDVYALGVILYELVAGELPYAIRERPTLEVLNAIIGESPRRFSGRRTAAGRLDGELEAIVLKALAKEPHRRYAGAGALAEDLDRYLANEPILARSPTAAYQIRKLVARHKGAFAAAVAVPVLLLVFGIAMSWQRQEAMRERRSAEAINETLLTMLSENNVEMHGVDVKFTDVLAEGSRLIGQLDEAPQAQAEIHRTLGDAYRTLGRHEEAESHLWAALRILEQLGAKDPVVMVETLHSLCEFLELRGEYVREDSLLQRALSFEDGLGDSWDLIARTKNLRARWLMRQGRTVEAEPLYREALAIRESALGDTAETVAATRNDLAAFLWQQGRYAEAEPLYRQAIATYRQLYGEQHTDLATMIGNLALLLTSVGQLRAAESAFLEALEMHRSLRGENHEVFALSLANLAYCLECGDRLDEATEHCRTALGIMRNSLGEDHPWVGYILHRLALCLYLRGDLGEAERIFDQALALDQRVLPAGHHQTVHTQIWLAILWIDTGRNREAEPILRESLAALHETFPKGYPSIWITQNALARCLATLGQMPEADSLFAKNRDAAQPISIPAKRLCLERTADLLARLGRNAEAASYRAELASLKETVR
jgi:tetratricopeptide (TPR) repeat protein